MLSKSSFGDGLELWGSAEDIAKLQGSFEEFDRQILSNPTAQYSDEGEVDALKELGWNCDQGCTSSYLADDCQSIRMRHRF